jgi:hypothetical protein
MFKKLLIANRGEIAVRVIRACREMGISTVAVYSTADENALHVSLADQKVCLGGPFSRDSYLKAESIIAAALATKAEAIHPGYGFLSENANFADLCKKNGLIFVGPDSDVIAQMGDKDCARTTMKAAGVPVIPGSEIVNTVEEAIDSGIIVPIADRGARQIEWEYIREGNLEQHFIFPVTTFFPERRILTFERHSGVFSGVYASIGDRVTSGVLLAEQLFAQEALEIERDRIQLQYEQFNNRFAQEYQWRTRELEETQFALDSHENESNELLLLKLAQQELHFEQFIFENNNRRQYFRRQLSRIDEDLKGEQIFAPFDGVIIYTSEIEAGETIELFRGTARPIAEIINDDIVHFTVSAPPTVIRFGDIFTLSDTDDNLFFDVKVISDPLASGTVADNMVFRLAAVCEITFKETLAEAGLTNLDLRDISFRLSASIPLAMDAVLVNHNAIHPEDTRNFVFVYEDGNLLKRYVTLGIRFGSDVQILFGPEPGQKVMLP